jgi:hypothetical protein
MNDTSIMLPPSAQRTIYVQMRNTSENQQATPSDIPARLSAKGYTVVPDPSRAAYWLQSQIVYCHKAADNVTPEIVAKSGFGAGIGSGGAPLLAAGGSGIDMRAMMAPFMGGGMLTGAGGMPDVNAMMRMAMASGGGGRMGMAPPPKPEGIAYICVADVLVTERSSNANAPPALYMRRSVAHVLQKETNIEEATPIIREKLAVGLVGPF